MVQKLTILEKMKTLDSWVIISIQYKKQLMNSTISILIGRHYILYSLYCVHNIDSLFNRTENVAKVPETDPNRPRYPDDVDILNYSNEHPHAGLRTMFLILNQCNTKI